MLQCVPRTLQYRGAAFEISDRRCACRIEVPLPATRSFVTADTAQQQTDGERTHAGKPRNRERRSMLKPAGDWEPAERTTSRCSLRNIPARPCSTVHVDAAPASRTAQLRRPITHGEVGLVPIRARRRAVLSAHRSRPPHPCLPIPFAIQPPDETYPLDPVRARKVTSPLTGALSKAGRV